MARFMRRMITVFLYRSSDEQQREMQVTQKAKEHVHDKRSKKSFVRSDTSFVAHTMRTVDRIFSQPHRIVDTIRTVKGKNNDHKTQEHVDVMHTLRAIGWSVRRKMQHHA